MATRRLQRRLAAIVSADISGYGLMMANDEDGTHRRVGDLVTSLSRGVSEFGGKIITIAGDGVLAEFVSPVNALRFGLLVHRHVRKRNSRRPADRRLALRVGVHMGDIVIHKGSVGGDSVNIAVRIEQVADPDSIFLSRTVYEQVHRSLSLAFEYVGQYSLKNVISPMALYRVAAASARSGLRPDELPSRAAGATDAAPSIAILPFENHNAGKADAFLVNGITDDLITALSRFRSLSVIDRHSSFRFGGDRTAPREIARGLGVRYLLTGSMRNVGRRIRLSAQLIDSFAHRTVWAEQYNAELNNVLAIADDIVEVIVGRLSRQIEAAERDRLRRAETQDLRAYGCVLRGEELLWSASLERNTRAREQFSHAIKFDPEYARAYAGLSRTHNLDWRYSWVDDRTAALDRAIEYARHAVTKDPMDARAHAELGYAYLYKHEIALSLAAYRTALDLNPNDPDIISDYADALVYDGRPQEAVTLMHRAMRLNPICPDSYYWHLADAYSGLGRYEDVIATILRMRDPGQCARLLAASFAHLDRREEAALYAAEVLRRQPGFSISNWAKTLPGGRLKNRRRFIEGLRKAGLPD
jgi:TolB-like protein/class 3 adenylate cyclase